MNEWRQHCVVVYICLCPFVSSICGCDGSFKEAAEKINICFKNQVCFAFYPGTKFTEKSNY